MPLLSDELFFSFQFPIVDVRPLLYTETNKISIPSPPPNALKNNEFIRNFGQVVYRNKREMLPFIEEKVFCKCDNLIKFPKLSGDLSSLNSTFFKVKHFKTSRRFFSNTNGLAKFEIIFMLKIEFEEAPDVQKNILKELIQKLSNLEVSLKGEETHRKFIDSGKYLAQIYLSSTTRASQRANIPKWWVNYGEPAIFVHGSRYFLPDFYKDLDIEQLEFVQKEEIALFYYLNIFKSQTRAHTWFCGDEVLSQQNVYKKFEYLNMRNLKIQVFAIHAKLQYLKFIFSFVKDGRLQGFTEGTEPFEILQRFLVDVEALLSDQSTDVENATITFGMFRMDNFLETDEKDLLLDKLKKFNFHPNTIEKAGALMDKQDMAKRKTRVTDKLKRLIFSDDNIKKFFEIIEQWLVPALNDSDKNISYKLKADAEAINRNFETGDVPLETLTLLRNQFQNRTFSFLDRIEYPDQVLTALETEFGLN